MSFYKNTRPNAIVCYRCNREHFAANFNQSKNTICHTCDKGGTLKRYVFIRWYKQINNKLIINNQLRQYNKFYKLNMWILEKNYNYSRSK